ncbi:MAG: Uma2 family endonuclease [Phormidesmis sp.]
MMTLTLEMQTANLRLNEDQFYRLCQANRDLRLELTTEGNLIIMPPTGWDTGRRNADLSWHIVSWAKADGTGIVFDSSTGFKLPSGATRSPDVSWVLRSRLEALCPDPNKFLPLCPDFVIELRSASDRLSVLQAKMQEYIDNGLKLGWLINPKDKTVEIYRASQAAETVPFPTILSGESLLPGLQINLKNIF